MIDAGLKEIKRTATRIGELTGHEGGPEMGITVLKSRKPTDHKEKTEIHTDLFEANAESLGELERWDFTRS